MNFKNTTAEVFIPDDRPLPEALSRVTHLGIGAHQDDLEFMAFHGIVECFEREELWFGGVTCTDGVSSARTGAYTDVTDPEMGRIRSKEQNDAATIGKYGAMMQLGYSSAVIKDPENNCMKEDLLGLLKVTRPDVVYTHNPADKHDTHISVVMATLQAIRDMPAEHRPGKVIGCEVWRDLDWLPDDEKVVMDVSGYGELATILNGVFKSQIAGGKRYDLAIRGRRAANATFWDPHTSDESEQLIFGMDLTPVISDSASDITQYVEELIQKFREDVLAKWK